MTTIVTRAGKGSPLTHTEVDTNFTNLNTNKLEAGAIALGSAATPSISFTGDTNTGIYSPGADQLAVATNGSQRLSIDASGNVAVDTNTLYVDAVNNRVAIGTTSPTDTLNISSSANQIGLDTGNQATYGTLDIGHFANGAFIGTQAGSDAASNLLRFGTSGTEHARIDSSGRLLVGTSTTAAAATELLQVEGIAGNVAAGGAISLRRASVGNSDQIGIIHFKNATEGAAHASISAICDGTPAAGDFPGALLFSTTADGAASPTERMRIISNGHMLLNTTSDLAHLTVVDSTYGASDIFIRTFGLSGTSFVVRGDGDCENTNNSYGAFSDIKLKENIVGASSQWNDIKALQVRNYNLKSNPSFAQIGLVAQEVETVSPGLVSELPDRDEDGNDLGTVTKSVKYSVLYMKAVKALQEAMERIETLESRITAAGIE